MDAQDFYQFAVEPSVLLSLVMPAELDNVTEALRALFSVQQFNALLGEVAVLGDATGQVVEVFIGQGHATPVQAIAHAINKIPTGVYRTETLLPLRAMVIWSLAQYRFDQYKPRDLSSFRVLVLPEIARVEVLAESTSIFMVRDLINKPPNALGPEQLGIAFLKLAERHGAHAEQWIGDELVEQRFIGTHVVGRAAEEAPRLLRLNWGNPAHPRVTLVGKGVCFDSGGLDIKPSSAMRLMKKDMGGAAQVMGLANWIMTLELPIYLEVFVPAVENAIGPLAFRPGDVLTMRNGLTVEIDNTDAEGRLILADALASACEHKAPDLLIDFATLTGAARVAVGTEISAFFTHDDALAEAITRAGAETGDAVWRLPLHAGYTSLLDSSVANLMNSSASSYAGAITAALFLDHFVPEGVRWVHFDIMAWNVSSKPGRPEGGEAMGIQAVAAVLKQRYGLHKSG